MGGDNSIIRLLSAYSKCVNRKSSSLVFLVQSKDLSQLSKLKDVLLKRRKGSFVHIQASNLKSFLASKEELERYLCIRISQVLFVSDIKSLVCKPDSQKLLLDVIISRIKTICRLLFLLKLMRMIPTVISSCFVC